MHLSVDASFDAVSETTRMAARSFDIIRSVRNMEWMNVQEVGCDGKFTLEVEVLMSTDHV